MWAGWWAQEASVSAMGMGKGRLNSIFTSRTRNLFNLPDPEVEKVMLSSIPPTPLTIHVCVLQSAPTTWVPRKLCIHYECLACSPPKLTICSTCQRSAKSVILYSHRLCLCQSPLTTCITAGSGHESALLTPINHGIVASSRVCAHDRLQS